MESRCTPFRTGLGGCIFSVYQIQMMEPNHMRTTLDIDRDLLERAKAVLGAATYTETIERSLARAVEQAEVEALLESVEGKDLVWSLDELRAFRHGSHGDAP
jgi:Arc/MetJ family transcription regulator